MNRLSKSIICILFGVAAGLSLVPLPVGMATWQIATQKADFKRDIEPIFAAACVQCHGPQKAAGQLRLDQKQAAFKGGISGPIIAVGDAAASRLVARILGEGGEQRMPLGGDPLTKDQIALIRQWIDEGASWPDEPADRKAQTADLPKHWAYLKPVQAALPAVKNQAWVRNPIDAFILARLEKEGLQPMPEADKATLLRRVYLDVTGLPPSLPEVDAFLADQTPNAYEKVVDRLLATPQYGERWARPWLDLARYADSNGYEKDNLRVMWKYRDWVINALNQDKPFDQFTIEQLAGDMLPKPPDEKQALDQLIATGFHRNTMVNQEGGIDPHEARYETIIDRVNTTSTVWLGSTLGCAQCHNHKYDPFTQKDYYRFYAFFETADYDIAYQSATKEEFTRYVLEPQLDLPTPEQATRRTAINEEIKKLEAQMKAPTAEAQAAQSEWERELAAEPQRWTPLAIQSAQSSAGATLTKQADQSVLASGAKAESDIYTITLKTTLSKLTGLRLEALPDPSLPQGGPGRDPYGNFLLTGLEVTVGQGKPVLFKDVKVDDAAYRPDPKDFFAEQRNTGATDRPAGWFINATGDEGERMTRQAVFVPATPLSLSGDTVLTIKLKQQGGALCQSIGHFRLSATAAEDPTRIVSISALQRRWLKLAAAQRSAKQQEALSDRFRSSAPMFKTTREQLEKQREALKALNIVTAQVMGERQSFERPATFVRDRGNFLNKGAQVYADVPRVLHPLPADAPVNRLGLARWLVNENNPLVGRVMVNRFWEQIFGRGIVETSEDFGSQSQPPSHPELLDWLAVEFMKPVEKNGHGWSMKKLVRLLVTSAAYRQSSKATPALLEKDPYNRLLARGPRFRLEAEMLRDNALAVSGLLARKIGGPSVMPLQPDGIWKAPYSSEKWHVSQGEDRYRRGLYTFVRRSSPYPMMLNFDGTSREFCTVRRTRTNTPLQALNALNDEALFEAARALAQRMLNEATGAAPARAAYGWRLCVARQPKAAEVTRLTKLYQQQLDYFTAHPSEAERVVKQQIRPTTPCSAAEMAAWTLVANVLLNLDETVSKE
jgi:mono/diheme cytochrome c family protein